MGSCLSAGISVDLDSNSNSNRNSNSPAAKVVSVNGDLREYNVPILVSQVLETESSMSSSKSSTVSYFMCNSDSLYYDEVMPAMNDGEQLHPNQIYFVLPKSKLQSPLTATDMAGLAVKASVAIEKAAKNESKRRGSYFNKGCRISPVIVVSQSTVDDVCNSVVKPAKKGVSLRQDGEMSRSGSVRRLSKYTSRRAKLAVRSFRLRLSTINEGSVL